MVRLVVSDERERLVNFHDGHFELCEGLVGFANLVRDRRLAPRGKIKVHDFVRETGELVAEAEVVFAGLCRGEVHRVVLFSLFLVYDAIAGSKECYVHVKVSSSSDLTDVDKRRKEREKEGRGEVERRREGETEVGREGERGRERTAYSSLLATCALIRVSYLVL